MSKLADQWIEIFRAGDYGEQGSFSERDLDRVVADYKPGSEHEAPIVIGHPETNAPAYGWVEAVKRSGSLLLAKFKQIQPAFEEMVESGAFKKRSASFYRTADGKGLRGLRHVGFLGATPPKVKGLADCKFSDRADSMHVEFHDNLEAMRVIKEINSRIGVDPNSVKLHAAVTEFCERENVDYATGIRKVLEKQPDFGASATPRGRNSRFVAADPNSIKLHEAVTEFCEKENVDYATGIRKVLEKHPGFGASATPRGRNSRFVAVDPNSVKLHEAVTEFCEKENVDYATGCSKVLEKHPELGIG